jgi:ribosomal protein L32E
MRDRRRGYSRTVTIGYGNNKADRGKFKGRPIVLIYNVADLMKADKKSAIWRQKGLARYRERLLYWTR